MFVSLICQDAAEINLNLQKAEYDEKFGEMKQQLVSIDMLLQIVFKVFFVLPPSLPLTISERQNLPQHFKKFYKICFSSYFCKVEIFPETNYMFGISRSCALK